jgi:hypothetical protein
MSNVRRHPVELSLTFVDNNTGHDDLVLHFAGQQWVCDSYYFAIDDHLLPEIEDEVKIRTVLRRLLEQWQEALHGLSTDGVAFLPYDFSDQYTGWLRCTRTQNGFAVTRGWSGVEGWSFSPSNVGDLLHKLEDFRADGPSAEAATQELSEAIDESMSRAA